MRQQFLLGALISLLLGSHPGAKWPRWAKDLRADIQCGQSIEEVRELSPVQIHKLDAGPHPYLGRYFASRGRSDLWLSFDKDGGLQSITLSQTRSWRIMKSVLSPKQNVCTGELTFSLRLHAQGEAVVSINGDEVPTGGRVVPLAAGHHEIVVQRGEDVVLIHRIELRPEDPGNPVINLDEVLETKSQ